jgi:hypothetical protein
MKKIYSTLIQAYALRSISQKIIIGIICTIIFSHKVKADFTINQNQNINANTISTTTGTLHIYGTLEVSSDVTFTSTNPISIILYGPSGTINWSSNKTLAFPAGSTINFVTVGNVAPIGLIGGNAASAILQIGTVQYAAANDNSNNVVFSFSQINSIGGTATVNPLGGNFCFGDPINFLANAVLPASVDFRVNWTAASGTFSVNNTSSASSTTLNGMPIGSDSIMCELFVNSGNNTFIIAARKKVFVTVKAKFTWLGVNSNWNDALNWCPAAPTAISDIVIPAGLSVYPLINNYSASVRNLTIATGASLLINGTGELKIAGAIVNNGVLNATDGTIEFVGSSTQNISGSFFANRTLKNLALNNANGLNVYNTPNDTLNITGSILFSNAAADLNTGDNITLKSSATATAAVGTVGAGNVITGKMIVERYINTGTQAGQHPKSWQFVAAPVKNVSIRNSWMESGLLTTIANGFGTWITAPASIGGGFDGFSATPSIKTFLPGANGGSWLSVPAATNNVHNQQGYMLYVRGDRSVFNFAGANSAPVPTVLRSKGEIVTGTQTAINVTAGNFQSVGNPYPSAVSFASLSKTSGIANDFVVWDPSPVGTSNSGRYQTITGILGYKPVPGGTAIYNSLETYPDIQSGQAVFVSATTANGTITFTESSKATGSKLVNREVNQIKMISTNLMAVIGNNLVLADGNAVVFDDQYSNGVDADDAMKLMNSGENFGLVRYGYSLAVEARKALRGTDTLYYQFNNVAQRAYKLMFVPENLPGTGLFAELIDGFLNTRTMVSLTDTTFIDISFTPNVLSRASNRFKLVFTPAGGPLPVTIISFKASRNTDKSIAVNWAVENQLNVEKYEVERSRDGKNFSSFISTAAAGSNNGNSYLYSIKDLDPFFASDNFYRLKVTNLNGKIDYSAVVVVAQINEESSIDIFPNPVTEGKFTLHLAGMDKGNYTLQMTALTGQVLNNTRIIINQSLQLNQIVLPAGIAPGTYQLKLLDSKGNSFQKQLFVY